MRKKRGSVLLALLLAGLFLQRAWGAVDAGKVVNPFTPGRVAITLEEPSFQEGSLGLPGGSIPKDPVVTNTGSLGVRVFLKVTIPKKKISQIRNGGIRPAFSTELFSFTAKNGWVEVEKKTDNARGLVERVYAYPFDLAPGETTLPLFTSLEVIDYAEGSVEDGCRVTVSLEAYAIQKEAAIGTNKEIYALFLRDSQ